MKETRSTLISNILRLGDPDNNPLEAIEITVKTSKCTALARPKSWKRFAPRESKAADEMDIESATARDRDLDEEDANKIVWAQLRMCTEFHVENAKQEDEDHANEDNMERCEKERCKGRKGAASLQIPAMYRVLMDNSQN